MVDLDTIPLAEPVDESSATGPAEPNSLGSRTTAASGRADGPLALRKSVSASALIVVLCSLHGLAIWTGMGGRAGLTNGWPIWHDDHPLYYHTASSRGRSSSLRGRPPVTTPLHGRLCQERRFPVIVDTPRTGGRGLRRKSPRICVQGVCAGLRRGCAVDDRPGRVHWQDTHERGVAIAILLDLLYIWTDFPINYAFCGMLPYFLAIPVALAATAAFARFLTDPEAR